MPTANEALLDALVRHQIGLMRLSGSVRNKIVDLLNETEKDLELEIRKRLANIQAGASLSPYTLRRLDLLEAAVKELREAAITKAFGVLTEEMRDLMKHETEFLAMSFQTVAPVVLDLAIPSTLELLTLVTQQPVEGKTLKKWAQDLKQRDVRRIMDQVRIGMVRGETAQQIAKRVVGTAALKGTDAVTEITRQHAAAITRTAVNFFSNRAKQAFYEANSDIVDEELYVATLDARTTPVCRSNDGKRFPLGKGPIPPLHFGCRSLRVAILSDKAIGERPIRKFTEQQLVREYAKANGLDSVRSRDGLPRGHKNSFDEFARRRARELTGRVPASTTYQQFLTRQSKQFQEDVLGKTKAKLFRDGKLPLDRFVNRNGDELTLSELAKRDKAAFRRAGLNPDDFR